MLQGCVYQHKPYVHVCMKVVCDQEDHVYGPPCLETTAGSDMIGPWTVMVGTGWTGSLSSSPTSQGTAWTTQIEVLEYGEGQGNGSIQQTLWNTTAIAVDQ
ncbi:hypothetical protein ACF0H5_013518 [Mactra antiquata]